MTGTRPRSSPASGRRSLIPTALAACVLTVLVTACIEVKMDFVVRDDGSGSAEVSMRLDEAVLGMAMFGEDGDPEQYCRELADEPDASDPMGFGLDAVDASTEAVVDSGDCLVTSTVTWIAEDSDAVLDVLMSDDGPGFRRLEDGGWRFDLDTAPLSEDVTDDELSEAAALGFDAPTLTLSVSLPGDAVEHNADTVSGSTYTWVFDTAEVRDFPDRIYLETAPGGGLGPEAIGAIVAGIALALAALVTLRRHRETKASESEDAKADPEPTDDDVAEAADEASDSGEDSGEAADDSSEAGDGTADDGNDDSSERSTET